MPTLVFQQISTQLKVQRIQVLKNEERTVMANQKSDEGHQKNSVFFGDMFPSERRYPELKIGGQAGAGTGTGRQLGASATPRRSICTC